MAWLLGVVGCFTTAAWSQESGSICRLADLDHFSMASRATWLNDELNGAGLRDDIAPLSRDGQSPLFAELPQPDHSACPTRAGGETALQWIAPLARFTLQVAHNAQRTLLPSTTEPLAQRVVEEVRAILETLRVASAGNATRNVAWCGTVLHAPSGERTTESPQEESNCNLSGCGGLGPLQWPSPDGGWGRAWPCDIDPTALNVPPTPSAVEGTLADMLRGGAHRAGEQTAQQLNSLHDGLTVSQWQRAWAPYASWAQTPRWTAPSFRPADVAALRSLIAWWQSSQTSDLAAIAANSAARTESDTAENIDNQANADDVKISARAEAITDAQAEQRFELIIDGPRRYLYLRRDAAEPVSAPIASPARQQTNPLRNRTSSNDLRMSDPTASNWPGCESFRQYSPRRQPGCSATELSRWSAPLLRQGVATLEATREMLVDRGMAALAGLTSQAVAVVRDVANVQKHMDQLLTAAAVQGPTDAVEVDQSAVN